MEKPTLPIDKFLREYEKSDVLRCHMPPSGVRYDITEIFGADSLYESSGIIRQSEQYTSQLFGSGDTLYSCGGSTLAIQAMLCVAKEKGSRVAAGRYSHRSLVSGSIMLGLDIEWLYPDQYLSADISTAEIARAVENGADSIFVTSIDYYGGRCDIGGIAAYLAENDKDTLLLVDNAHGAYRVFGAGDSIDNHLDTHPIKCGAHLCADSAHKTLPVLTGGAYLHLHSDKYHDMAKNAMSMFGSSSPSYLILQSLDLCTEFLYYQEETAKKAIQLVKNVKDRLKELGFTLKDSDLMRITIDCCEAGYSGDDFAAELRRLGVEPEMSDECYVVLLLSVVFGESDAERLVKAMEQIKPKKPLAKINQNMLKPEKVMPVRDAFFTKKENLALKNSCGRICAQVCAPCPPGIPLVMPGERLDEMCLYELGRLGVEKIDVVK